MEAVTYRLDQFEGPLDLLLTLIQKNKVNIEDIPISLICDQYLEYIQAAQDMDMEIAGEFIVMASELMLIKSRMLLPRVTEEEKDPRAELADALLRYQQAKQAAQKMAPLYSVFSGRMVKDTDEISVDKTYVADQQVTSLCAAVRRIIAANESRPKVEKQIFAPMIAKPIVPVEVKIVGILHRMSKAKNTSMRALLSDATSLPDLIAIFLGILELIKVRKIRIEEDPNSYTVIHGTDTEFSISDEEPPSEENKPRARRDDDEPIPLSSKAEMHREQRRIIREQKLAEKKRLREEERARRAEERRLAKEAALRGEQIAVSLPTEELPDDDSDLEAEAKLQELLDEQLSEDQEAIMDDLGLDMQRIVTQMAHQAKEMDLEIPTEPQPQ
ncbi:MAG: segregation/condensation protein A [Clostridia bacterium]|nr:segregation/condensation protein A [Clostridia bacterium]